MNKRGMNSYMYLALAIGFIVLLGIVFQTTILPTNPDNPGDGWQRKTAEGESEQEHVQEGSNNIQTQGDAQEGTTEGSNGAAGGGGGGGGSGGGGSEGGSSQSCTEQQITYTIQGNPKQETCVNYDNQSNCIEKNVFCSANIQNIDTISADFTIRLVFVEDGKDKETEFFGETIESFMLESGESYDMSHTENIQSTGENGRANQVINCFFNTVGDVTGCV